ncbi:hypothetical protein M434DRAFT_15311 [Hypoxylon sp. CO27-5]|nr:hypothetical protein M434DRAFT_15311 [Hypoxylon sp. CO27-5]
MSSSPPTQDQDTWDSAPSYSHDEIIAAVHEFYVAIIKLPYIDPDALVLPPAEGWPGVREDELRKRGKTDEVVGLLRHLPYLRNPGGRKKWMLSPDTCEIAYCDGEMYDDIMDELQPTPPHCIWLTTHDSRDGVDLLLDTHTGSVTQWAMLGGSLMFPYDEYEQLAKEDKWMAYPTLPARDFFQLWQARWEKLVWLPVHSPAGGRATALWWYRVMPGSDDEEAILISDDEFTLDSGHGDDEDVSSSPESEEQDEDDETALSDSEVNDILQEAFGGEAQSKRVEFALAQDYEPFPPRSPVLDLRSEREKRSEKRTKIQELYQIYKDNGWPSNFDREKCKLEIEEFRQKSSLL